MAAKQVLLLPLTSTHSSDPTVDLISGSAFVNSMGSWALSSSGGTVYADSYSKTIHDMSHIDINMPAEFNVNSSDYCIEFWANVPSNVSSSNQMKCLLWLGDATAINYTNFIYLAQYSYDGSPRLWAGATKSSGFEAVESVGLPAPAQWHHYAITVGSNNLFSLFLNGVFVGSKTIAMNGIASKKFRLHIGSDPSTYPSENKNIAASFQDICITIGTKKYTSNFTPPDRLSGLMQSTVIRADGLTPNPYVLIRSKESLVTKKITPNLLGEWSTLVEKQVEYDVSYFADGLAPQIHAFYSVD